MGIRFFCPKGHKLNVKAELAGKIGICPKCGERMLIPLISTRKSGESRSPDSYGHEAEQPDLAPETELRKDMPTENDPTELAIELPGNPDSEPFVSDHVDSTEPVTSTLAIPGVAPEGTNGSMLDDPNVLWYVRTLENQTYGPAAGPVIQSWIHEKRIGPKMFVWREGWASWLEAGNVFPELEDVFSGPVEPADPVGPASAPIVTESESYDPLANKKAVRHKKATRDLIVVICLIVVIIALIAGLIAVLVLQHRSENAGGESGTTTSMKSTGLENNFAYF